MPFAETNGVRTHYEDTGGDRPAVVLIHGHSLDLRMWRPQMRPLSEAGFRAITYDIRGHGKTDAASGLTWHNYASDLDALLGHLGLESAHLVACSMGGGVALMSALVNPARVRSITLVDSTLPGYSYSNEFSMWIARLRAAYWSEGAAAFENHWLSHAIFDGVRRFPETMAAVREMVLAFPAHEYQQGYAAEIGYVQPDIAVRLHEIAVPTLAIAGDSDIDDFRMIAEIAASTIPGARLHTFEDAGHLPSMERPDAFNSLLIGFLNDVERGRS